MCTHHRLHVTLTVVEPVISPLVFHTNSAFWRSIIQSQVSKTATGNLLCRIIKRKLYVYMHVDQIMFTSCLQLSAATMFVEKSGKPHAVTIMRGMQWHSATCNYLSRGWCGRGALTTVVSGRNQLAWPVRLLSSLTSSISLIIALSL